MGGITVCASSAASGDTARNATRSAIEMARASLGARSPDLAFVFASPKHPLSHALAEAKKLLPSCDVVGCSTSGEITSAGLSRGSVAVCLASFGEAAFAVSDVVSLEGDPIELARQLAGGHRGLVERARSHGWTMETSIVLGDGMSLFIEPVVVALRRVMALEHPVVGGGAGDDAAFVEGWVGAGDRTVRGGAVAVHVASRARWGIGVGQGVAPSSSRMTVTRAQGNTVYELDGKRALDVYAEHAKSRGESFGPESYGAYLVSNEIGIYFFDDIVRVRAGLAVNDEGGIVCAGEVPEGSVVAIVRGTPESFVAAAGEAARTARDEVAGDVAGVLVFSCVTRGLIMGDGFDAEVRAIADVFGPDVPIAGFLSYGEIARVKGKLDGYHNNTVVVVAIPA